MSACSFNLSRFDHRTLKSLAQPKSGKRTRLHWRHEALEKAFEQVFVLFYTDFRDRVKKMFLIDFFFVCASWALRQAFKAMPVFICVLSNWSSFGLT